MTRAPLLVFGLCIGLAGCRTIAGPGLVPAPQDTERVSLWLERERESADQRRGLQAVARLILDTPRGKLRAKQVVLVQRPRQLRLESQNLLGQTQSLLVMDGSEFAYYDGAEIEHGVVSETLLLDSLGLDLAPEEAVRLLLADPPFPEAAVPAVFVQGDSRVAVFEQARVFFSSNGELEGFERLERSGAIRWRADFAGWRELGNGRYPFAMQLDFPASQLQARLEFQDAALNPSLLESLFRLEIRSHSTN